MNSLKRQAGLTNSIDDPALVRDILVLVKKYFKRDAFFDILANFHIVIFLFYHDAMMSNGSDMIRFEDDNLFMLCMGLKTLRLFHAYQVADSLRRLMDVCGDIFYTRRYMLQNVLSWLLATQRFIMSIHYFACGWVLIYNLKVRADQPTIEMIETRQFHIYIEAWYLMTTTITTVGYGDYTVYRADYGPIWEIEMIYLAFVTLIGILLFSSVTNEIFNY